MDAAKKAEAADTLRGEIAELKAQGESDYIDFKLQLAGVRNIKAARAAPDDRGMTLTSSRPKSRVFLPLDRAAGPWKALWNGPTRLRRATPIPPGRA